jgi:Cyclic nucleotide-binding domain
MKRTNSVAQIVRAPRWRRRLLVVSQVAVLLAAAITFLAVYRPGPIRLGLFLVVAQPAILLGVIIYLTVAISELLGSRGVSRARFDAGETIFRQGDPGDCMYAVIEGEVEVVREEPGTEPKVIARLGPGQYFGEMALVSAGPRMATVRALTAVEVAVMGRVEFTTLYAYLPDFHESIEEVVRQRRRPSHGGTAHLPSA